MHITHSYLGTIKRPHRCLFFLLLEDYIEAQTGFVKELEPYLERFARNMGDDAAFVRPFTGDIEKVHQEVLDKPWTEVEREELRSTPALLMLDQDFAVFDPRTHPWLVLNFGRRQTQHVSGVYLFTHVLDDLVAALQNDGEDFFSAARALKHEIAKSECSKLFEAKPGAFGFSIDLYHAGSLLHRLYRRMKDHSGKSR